MNDRYEAGNAIDYGWTEVKGEGSPRIGYIVVIDMDEAMAALKADAARFLPPSTRFELRRRLPANDGRSHGIAWYHNRFFADDTSWGDQVEREIITSDVPGYPRHGYIFVGQFVTPNEKLS